MNNHSLSLITRRFLAKLCRLGYIDLENMGNTTRLRVLGYDRYVGKPDAGGR